MKDITETRSRRARRLLALALAFALCAFLWQPGTADTLEKGSKGADVRALQTRLMELDYLSGKADDSYSSATVEAVRAFQGQVNLPCDGIADEETQSMLFDADAPARQAFDFSLMEPYIEEYYFDYEENRWVWESSANYLDEESWPKGSERGEPYAAMGLYATGNGKGRQNSISWRFLCFAEEQFLPTKLTVALPNGERYAAAIRKANRRSTEFPDEVGWCTQVNATLGSRGIEILFTIAHMTDDELDALEITLSDGEREMKLDARQSSISYDPFIEDLRLFVKAWGECGGFSAKMAKESAASVSFKKDGK